MRSPCLLILAVFALPSAASAQDVELLGERYGTRPPAAYYETVRENPDAFRFAHGRAARMRARAAAADLDPGLPRVLGPPDGPVVGTFRMPVILGLFSDSPQADAMRFGGDDVSDVYFGPGAGTIPALYAEMSRGKATIVGDVQDWTRASATTAQATRSNGLVSGTTGLFIQQLLTKLTDVDWALYDNDGPDGVPNSGDDDGFVDALAVVHPTAGAECGGGEDGRIWSHKWALRWAAGQAYTTTVPAAGGGFIRVDDYFIQPIFGCDGSSLNEIGVFAHELGHAFGLPDLYDTLSNVEGRHAGAGFWELMASGSFGCDGTSQESPCHMGAWSKAVLGWVDVVTLGADVDHGTLTLPPVETSGTVFRVDAGDGSGEYFLLENRQRIGFDQHLLGEGLLVWHIDPDWLSQRWVSNTINAYQHRGVWLRQADGRDDLGTPGRGRGDADDPYPWVGVSQENRSFHAGSRPAATSHLGTPTGLTITDASLVGDDVQFRLLTRFTEVSIRSEGGAGTAGIFTVDGAAIPGASHAFTSAPFATHEVVAIPGEELEPGVRRPFTGWDDDAEAPAARTLVTPLVDTEFVARYGGRQLQLSVESAGGINGVLPGTFTTSPESSDLWFDEGASISIEAVPTVGFGFLRWTGALAGQPNPASLTMTQPALAGATFELTYALPSTPVELAAASAQAIELRVENGTPPVVWQRLVGDLPEGLVIDPFGRITGAALEAGDFPVTFKATDARGLSAEGEVVLRVASPALGVDQLTAAFFGVGPQLDALQVDFLDHNGNRDGRYDLGDFRAWVLANPDLPSTARMRALLGPRTVVVPMRPSREGGGR